MSHSDKVNGEPACWVAVRRDRKELAYLAPERKSDPRPAVSFSDAAVLSRVLSWICVLNLTLPVSERERKEGRK